MQPGFHPSDLPASAGNTLPHSVATATAPRPRDHVRETPGTVGPFWSGLWFTTLCVLVITGMLALLIWRMSMLPPVGALGVTATATPIATSTPVTPSPTPLLPPPGVGESWGANAALTTFSTQLPQSTLVFQATGITPDGKTLLGVLINPAPGGHTGSAQAGILDVASKHFTSIGLPISDVITPPVCCQTDGRFVVASDFDQQGTDCGPCHVRYWAYDLQTGQSRQVAKGSTNNGINHAWLDSGKLLLAFTDGSFQIVNLATGTSGPPAFAIQPPGILAFAWPYVIHTGVAAGSVYPHALNLSTGTDTDLSAFTGPLPTTSGAASAVVVGDSLIYAASPHGTGLSITQLAHFATPGAQPAPLGTFPDNRGILQAANARLISFQGSTLVWDRQANHLVQTSTATTGSSATVALAGHFLVVCEPGASPLLPMQVTIYDTATLPALGT